MFGTHFYHQRIRRAVSVFGAIFNNIYVLRKNSAGEIISQVKVPLSYAPKRDFLDRIAQMDAGENRERQIAIKLPRMSFEIIGMNYDAARQLPKTNNCKIVPTSFDGTSQKLYTPVPYAVQFQLSVYAKSQDDALQIVEQILPYYTPQYTVTVNPLDDYDVKEDTPITLTGITFSDDYEGPLEARRTIVYTLDFEMRIHLYKAVETASKVITSYDIDVKDINDKELFTTISSTANNANITSASIDEDGSYVASNFKIDNIVRTVTSFEISENPDHGTATTEFDRMSTSPSGIKKAFGSWSYTPNADYNGSDSFKIKAIFDDESHLIIPINITIAPHIDIANDNDAAVDTALNSFIDIDVGENDDFNASVLVYSVETEPSDGSATVVDAANGVIRYTPDSGFVGTDTFTYTVSPEGGTEETATVTISVTESILMAIETGETLLVEDGSLIAVEE